MANYYVRSGAAGAGTGADWANAYTTLVTALSGKTNADTLWVANDHSESAVGLTLTCPTSPGLRILGVNTAVTEPPTGLNATPVASVAATGNAALDITGFAYIDTILFLGSTNANGACSIFVSNNAAPGFIWANNCKFDLRSTSTVQLILGGTGASDDIGVVLTNCQVKFGAVGHTIKLQSGQNRIVNMSFDSVGSSPTTLFASENDRAGFCMLEASDLSAEAWTNLVNVAWPTPYLLTVRNCKLPASTNLTTGTHSGPGGLTLKMHNCDSGDTVTNFGEAGYGGSVIDETTIVRTGGGVVSARMDSSANTKFPYNALCIEGAIRNTAVGSAKTLTVEYVHDINVAAGQGAGAGSVFQNDQLWVEVIHLGTAGVPLGVLDIDDRKADVFATAADQTSSSVAWTTTGMTTPTKGKLECTFTPQEAGYVHFKVHLAAASKTIYVDVLGASIA